MVENENSGATATQSPEVWPWQENLLTLLLSGDPVRIVQHRRRDPERYFWATVAALLQETAQPSPPK